MLTLNEEQDQNWELAQQINRDARTDPDSPYAGKIIGILDGQIAVIGDTLDEVMQELMKREPDPWRRWVVEADTDCDTTYDIWRAMATLATRTGLAWKLSERMELHFPHLTARKQRLDAFRPLPPEGVRNLKEYFDIAWTHHSTAIEGNTLTESETRAVLLDGVTIAGKSLREHFEVVNHKHAIDRVEAFVDSRQTVTEETVRELHALVLRGIDDAQAGRYRTINVRIGGSAHVPPPASEVPRRMAEWAVTLDRAEIQLIQEPEALHPITVAARAHHRLVFIHPFADGNGRTARLVMNLVLMRHGYPPAVLRRERRPDYYATLEEAHLTGNEAPFANLVAEAVEESLDIYLQTVGAA